MSGAADRGAPSDPAVVGRIVRPHGLAGEVVVAPVDASPVSFERGSIFWSDGRWLAVTRARVDNKGRWVIALEGIAHRDAAGIGKQGGPDHAPQRLGGFDHHPNISIARGPLPLDLASISANKPQTALATSSWLCREWSIVSFPPRLV